MATDNLKFEFLRRWTEIGKKLFPDATPAQSEALNMLEQNMRDLEDAWPSGGGGTAQSILSTTEHTSSFGANVGNLTNQSYVAASVAVPSDASFDYYLEWDLNAVLTADSTSSADVTMEALAQITGQSPGAGFEKWGILTTMPATTTAPAAPFSFRALNGHGHRTEHVDPVNLGTTITLTVQWSTYADSGLTWRLDHRVGAKLIAIPN